MKADYTFTLRFVDPAKPDLTRPEMTTATYDAIMQDRHDELARFVKRAAEQIARDCGYELTIE